MTKEQAIDACKQHATDVQTLSALLALSGISFVMIGPEVEKGLGLPKETLATALKAAQKPLISALSEYAAILENAAKGQLSQVAEEWSDTID